MKESIFTAAPDDATIETKLSELYNGLSNVDPSRWMTDLGEQIKDINQDLSIACLQASGKASTNTKAESDDTSVGSHQPSEHSGIATSQENVVSQPATYYLAMQDRLRARMGIEAIQKGVKSSSSRHQDMIDRMDKYIRRHPGAKKELTNEQKKEILLGLLVGVPHAFHVHDDVLHLMARYVIAKDNDGDDTDLAAVLAEVGLPQIQAIPDTD